MSILSDYHLNIYVYAHGSVFLSTSVGEVSFCRRQWRSTESKPPGLSGRPITSINTSHPRLQEHCGRGSGKRWALMTEVESWEMLICCHDMVDEHISSQQQWLSGSTDGAQIQWWSYEKFTAERGKFSLLWGCGCGYVVALPQRKNLVPSVANIGALRVLCSQL